MYRNQIYTEVIFKICVQFLLTSASDLAISQLKIVERVYLADNEKNYYKEMRSSDSKLGEDKVKLARIQYRGKGKYIDEILY